METPAASKVRWLRRPPHNVKGKCRWCLKDVPTGRRSWCSQTCVDEYLIRSSSGHVRDFVFRRDKGVCAGCGLDCGQIEKQLKHYRRLAEAVGRHMILSNWHIEAQRRSRLQTRYPAFARRVMRLYRFVMTKIEQDFKVRGLPFHSHRKTFWDADHIVEVAEGGGLCGLDNYQTLCLVCHQRKTTKLAGKLARTRREERTGQLEMTL